MLNDVVLNQVLVSFGTPDALRGDQTIQAEGTCWCGGTVWQGQTAMRISVSSWATTDADVERSLVAMLRAAASCEHMLIARDLPRAFQRIIRVRAKMRVGVGQTVAPTSSCC